MRVRITKELPEGVSPRPVVGQEYEAERKRTPDDLTDAYYLSTGVWVFPEECVEVGDST